MPAKMEGDWNWQNEDRSYLNALRDVPMRTSAWRTFSRPPEVGMDWHRTEDQGQIGSCQGHALSSVLERLAFVNGEKVQLSEIFAYLASQKIDGLLGRDNGSTISGGCKVGVEVGCCKEDATGYPRSYPTASEQTRILAAANYTAAAKYKAKSAWRVPDDHDALLDFIGGGGGVNFGIMYYSGLIPRDRIVRTYNASARGGGHAMCLLGYDRDGNLLAANSHADGLYKIMPAAWKSMLQHRQTAAIGLMGNREAVPVNWHTNSPYFK